MPSMSESEADDLKKVLDAINGQNRDALLRREKWGEINLNEAKHDFDRIFFITDTLAVMPLDYLTDKIVTQIKQSLDAIQKLFTNIDEFSISIPDATQAKNSFIAQAKKQADQLFTTASLWIPFLAYQKGDVAENIKLLTSAVTDANAIVATAKSEIETKQDEIQSIIAAAREASAGAGAAVFTKDFADESKRCSDAAWWWLIFTGLLALAAIGLGVVFVSLPQGGLDSGQLVQRLIGKFAILGFFITATLWCGRIYKALMHQSAINRHRSLSIQTLQAFANAAADTQAKDAVLMEVTRAVFGSTQTGYIDSKETHQDASIKVFDVAKAAILPKADG